MSSRMKISASYHRELRKQALFNRKLQHMLRRSRDSLLRENQRLRTECDMAWSRRVSIAQSDAAHSSSLTTAERNLLHDAEIYRTRGREEK